MAVPPAAESLTLMNFYVGRHLKEMTSKDCIRIVGAKQNNLKNLSLEIPLYQIIAITGVSGSGKSSLALDTLYAEGQRRYVESLSAYARQFLGQMQKPDVDYIEGLSPAIAIEQKSAGSNPRSTVGTITEIYDYLRLLFARIGIPHCPVCKIPIKSQTVQQIVDKVMGLQPDTKIMVLAPVVRGRKGEYARLFENIKKEGFLRVRVDGKLREIEEKIHLEKNKKHNIEIVIDRLSVNNKNKKRLTASVETAIKIGEGLVIINEISKNNDILFSEKLACPKCGFSMAKLEPRLFSFNNPFGACPECMGIGTKVEVDENLVVNPELSILEGAIKPWNNPDGYYFHYLRSLSKHMGFSLATPFYKLHDDIKKAILYGLDEKIQFHYKKYMDEYKYYMEFEGVIPYLKRRYRETEVERIREDILTKYMREITCSACKGKRLKPEALSVKIAGHSIIDLSLIHI